MFIFGASCKGSMRGKSVSFHTAFASSFVITEGGYTVHICVCVFIPQQHASNPHAMHIHPAEPTHSLTMKTLSAHLGHPVPPAPRIAGSRSQASSYKALKQSPSPPRYAGRAFSGGTSGTALDIARCLSTRVATASLVRVEARAAARTGEDFVGFSSYFVFIGSGRY